MCGDLYHETFSAAFAKVVKTASFGVGVLGTVVTAVAVRLLRKTSLPNGNYGLAYDETNNITMFFFCVHTLTLMPEIAFLKTLCVCVSVWTNGQVQDTYTTR